MSYLDGQQEEVEVVLGEGENVLVGDRHEDRGATVTDDREDWVVLPVLCDRCIPGRGRRSAGRAEATLLVTQLEVVALEHSLFLFLSHSGAMSHNVPNQRELLRSRLQISVRRSGGESERVVKKRSDEMNAKVGSRGSGSGRAEFLVERRSGKPGLTRAARAQQYG